MEFFKNALSTSCIILIVIGSLFVIIDLRTRFDKIFRYFGITLILISIMGIIDLHTNTFPLPVHEKLLWQKTLHQFACFFFAFSGIYLIKLTHLNIPWLKYCLIIPALTFSLLAFSQWMLTIKSDAVVGGSIYIPLFFPYVIFYIGTSLYALILHYLNSLLKEKFHALIHLLAFGLLCLLGLMDMIGIVQPEWKFFYSFKIFGIILFGSMSTYVFIEKYFFLINERNDIFNKVNQLRKELEDSDPLRKLGESAAKINHEIKNYISIIKANNLLLEQKYGNLQGQTEVGRISRSTESLEKFTRSILNYASSKHIGQLSEFSIKEAFLNCTENHFETDAHKLKLSIDHNIFIHGDKLQFEQVLLNIIKNALDAEAEKIYVGVESKNEFWNISIEDNGIGCTEKELSSIGEPFFSTKRKTGGNGLGLAISKAIIQSYGGHIHIMKPQNNFGTTPSGLRIEIFYPKKGALLNGLTQ